MSEAQVTDTAAEPKPKRWRKYVTLSVSAFIMSVTITLINAYYALQGAELVIQAPRQVLLYRDGEGADSVLAMAVRIDMINAASGYGDVLVDAEIEPIAGGPSFDFQGVATPVFTSTSAESAKSCELGARCLALPGLLLVERTDQVNDMPGGAAKAITLTFPATGWNCTGPKSACEAYGNFDRAVASLATKPLNLRVRLHFHADGDRVITCRGGAVNAEYLRGVGWISPACETRKVSGEPWL